MSKITLIFLTALFTTCSSLGVAYFVQWLKDRSHNKHQHEIRQAYKVLFETILYSYSECLKNGNPHLWENSLWTNHQAEFAEFFPHDTTQFAKILLRVQYPVASTLLPGCPDHFDVIQEIDDILQHMQLQQK